MTTDTDSHALARLLLAVADDLDRRGYFAVGAVRRAAHTLAAMPTLAANTACPVDGNPVEQPRTGHPRTYCSRRCKDRARRASKLPRKSTLDT